MKRSQNREPPFRFRPFSEKQAALIRAAQPGSPHSGCDILLADGSIRSGKTIACICGFVLFTGRFCGENFILAGKTLGALHRNVVGPMLRILTAFGLAYQYNRSDNTLSFGGNTCYLYGAYDEKAQDRLQGLTAAGALGDEAALFPRNFVEQMIARCSVAGAKIFLNCNPASARHYLKTEYIDQAAEKRIAHFHFTLDDNPSLSRETRERYERMYTGVFYQRFVRGEWVQAEGVIYDMFSDRNRTAAPPLCEEYAISCDYGTQNATVFLLWGRAADGRWYALREYYYSGRDQKRQKTDGQYLADLLAFVGKTPVTRLVIDPSAASFIALLRQQTRFRILKAKNDVLSGIRLTGRALEEGRIVFSSACVHTLDEFAAYCWDLHANSEDRPRKENDHAMDAVRYFVATILQGGKGLHVME